MFQTTTGIEKILDGFKQPTNFSHEISINYIPSDEDKEPKYDKATQEFDAKEECNDKFGKAVEELSNHLDALSDVIFSKDTSTKEKPSEGTNHTQELINKMVEKKKAEDPKFESKMKDIKETIKKTLNISNEEKVQKVIDKENKKDLKLYNQIKNFIISTDFIPAFLWFMENSYNNVAFAHQHKRRIYEIYKDLIKGNNLYGVCINDEGGEYYDCEFIIHGSKKAVVDFINNRQVKFAKILTKYIIASNTAPYVLQLMGYDRNADFKQFNALPTATSTVRSVYRSEQYVKVLEKLCFGRYF